MIHVSDLNFKGVPRRHVSTSVASAKNSAHDSISLFILASYELSKLYNISDLNYAHVS